jgi:hypothetical protein
MSDHSHLYSPHFASVNVCLTDNARVIGECIMGVLSVFVFVAMCVVVVAYLVFADSVLKNNKKDKDKQNQRGN